MREQSFRPLLLHPTLCVRITESLPLTMLVHYCTDHVGGLPYRSTLVLDLNVESKKVFILFKP